MFTNDVIGTIDSLLNENEYIKDIHTLDNPKQVVIRSTKHNYVITIKDAGDLLDFVSDRIYKKRK